MKIFYRAAVALVVGALLPLLVLAPPVQAAGVPQPGIVSANPVDFTPHALDGRVLAIAVVGSTVYVGGDFTQVRDADAGSPQLTRNYLFAFDAATGDIDPSFTPALDGAVESIAAAPNGSVIVAGAFNTVNGTPQRSLTMLAADGSRVSSFAASTNGYVNKVLVRGDRLVAGGRFSAANGAPRANLAVLDATTGALDSFDIPVTEGRTKGDGTTPGAAVMEMDADAAGTRLVVVGNFRQVGGQPRQQIAMVDLVGGAVTDWYTNRFPNDRAGRPQEFQCSYNIDTQMRDVEFSPDGSYFVVVTTGASADRNVKSLCDTATRWETAASPGVDGAKESWTNCTGGDTLLSVATTGSAIYVGGHQRWLDNCGGYDDEMPGSFAAEGVGALDPVTGKAIRTWNPGRTRGIGAEELVADAEGVYIGSDTELLNKEYHGRLGLFPASERSPVITIAGECNRQTGTYDGTVTINAQTWSSDPGAMDWAITGLTPSPVPVGVPLDVRQDDRVAFVGSFAGLRAGVALTVVARASWYSGGAPVPGLADIERSATATFPAACPIDPPAPPTTPAPPTPPTTPVPPTPPTPGAEPTPAKTKPRVRHDLRCGSVRLTADNRKSRDGDAERATVRFRMRVGDWTKVYKVKAGRSRTVQRTVERGETVSVKAIGFSGQSWSSRAARGCTTGPKGR